MAVGEGGHITYTDDYTRTWQRSQSGTTSTLRSIAFSPKLCAFATVGDKRSLSTVQLCNPPTNSSLPTVTSNIGLSFGPGCITSWTTATNICGGSTSTNAGGGGGGGGGGAGTWKIRYTFVPRGSGSFAPNYVNTVTTATSEPSIIVQSPYSLIPTDYDRYNDSSHATTSTSGADMQFDIVPVGSTYFTSPTLGHTLSDPANMIQWEVTLPDNSVKYSGYSYGGTHSYDGISVQNSVGYVQYKNMYNGEPDPPGLVDFAGELFTNESSNGPRHISFTKGAPQIITVKLVEARNAGGAGNVVATLDTRQIQITWI
jgi:hypothetical protein